MMICGIVGNRTGWVYKEIENLLDTYLIEPERDIIISGGASGVDSFVQQYAKKKGIEIHIYYPSPRLSSPTRYFARNKRIVNDCGLLIAFDKKEYSGTLNVINEARRQNKTIIIYPKKKV